MRLIISTFLGAWQDPTPSPRQSFCNYLHSEIEHLDPVTVIAKVQQPPRPSSVSTQPTSYVVVDDQQPGTSRQMIFNPPSVAASQQGESQHNTSGLSSLFAVIPGVLQYQQMDTPQPFLPSQLQPAPSPVPSSTHHEHLRPSS